MQTKKSTKSAQRYNQTKSNFRFADIFIIVFFPLLAFISVILFRQDLLQTLNIQNKEPAGIVIVKKNIVQRRLGDRVLWDRLVNESPVYPGDLIRVADISSALLDIEDNSIDLDENTLVRITRSDDGEGFQIQLSSGKVSVSSGSSSKGVYLEINGQNIKTGPGTVLSASAGKDGVSLQVTAGTAQISQNGNVREDGSRVLPRNITSGQRIAMDVNGKEIVEKAAVVTRPIQNARYLKTLNEPIPVNFEWNRVNFRPDEKLRLEIAIDKNFKQIIQVVPNLDSKAQVSVDKGMWYWRLSSGNTVLSDGLVTVADGAGLQLISPALNSLFRYRDNPPVMNFQWSQEEDASSYIIEVSRSADFSSSQIRAQVAFANYSDSSLGDGTWYWRVMPVFPDVYNGNSSFSQPAFFRIEQGAAEPVVAEPATGGRNSLDNWLSSILPSKTELPSDLPPEIVPPELKPEPKLEYKAEPKPEQKPEPKPEQKERVKPELRLLLPKQGDKLEGLTALRRQTVFTWECGGKVAKSRFVLSKNPNPLQGGAAVEIQNPGNTVRVDNLGEGVWYWNVEAVTADGFTVSAPAARQLQVMPVPLLPPPENVTPRARQRYGLKELRNLNNIVFEWKTVKGANAYTFALYQQTEDVLRRIASIGPADRTSFILDDLKVLENGTFVWQVEALNIGRDGTVEQHGRPGEYFFVLDFPPPEPVHIEDMGILYGN